VSLTLPQLPPEFNGLRIVQVSDVHAGPYMPVDRMRRVADLVMANDPDLIVFTGDQIDRHPAEAESFALGFAGLAAPCGVFGILGNHDHYIRAALAEEALVQAGITPLVNSSHTIRRNGSRVALVGLEDLWTLSDRHPDFTMLGQDPLAFKICLCHQPRAWLTCATAGAHLTLSGHTHGGQITVPNTKVTVARFHTRFIAGPYRRDDAFLYVSRGVGVGAIPVRVGAPPEVDVLTLYRSDVAAQAVA